MQQLHTWENMPRVTTVDVEIHEFSRLFIIANFL